MNVLDKRVITAYIPNPFLNPTSLRMALAEELGIQFARNIGQHRLLGLITERLLELNAAGQQVVLLLDEAQALPDDSLEALRLLTNLETEKRKLLQVVLFAQPELDTRLAQQKFRQLRQRVVFSYALRPLDRQSLDAYVEHRLRIAGYQGQRLFNSAARKRLYRASRGIPRLANLLCHKALMSAYGMGDRRIKPGHIHRAARDTEAVSGHRPGWVAVLTGLAGILALTSASILYAYTA
jgi:MSHA biogenesis protein MshM